jgi:hypothetical protein
MLKIESNIDAFADKVFGTLAKQLPYAASRAVNDTAKDVLAMVPGLMDSVFDRPTPYAKGAFTAYYGDKNDPVATVMRKPDALDRRFLEVEASGGARKRKGFETQLETNTTFAFNGGVSAVLQSAIIADGAKLDQYGNWSSGERAQVMADVRAGIDPLSYSTPASRKKAKRKAVYFVPKSGLYPGVYKRQGGVLSIILAFSSHAPTYAPRFPFQEKAAETAKARFAGHFAARFAQAVASAR